MTLAQQGYAAMFDNDQERDELLLEQLPQVRYIARRIHERLPQHVPFEDLVHAGVLGLVDAFNKYDHRKNVQFRSYAGFRIRGAILDSLREMDWSPRDLRRKARKLAEVNSRLASELGRAASEQELAQELGMDLNDFRHMLTEIGGLELDSLQSQREQTGDELSELVPGDPQQTPFAACLKNELRDGLAQAISELSEKEQQVLALYYFEELTMKEVGEVLGVGESRVSQIHSLALVRLRTRLNSKSLNASRAVVFAPDSHVEDRWRRF